MDKPSELRLAEVMPELAARIRHMAFNLSREGIYIRVTQGLRTIEQQNALYAIGRTQPGKIVTNAHGGMSYHNYGLAVDCVPSLNGALKPFAPDWNPAHESWQRMEAEGRAHDLTTGADFRTFPDYPHFQLNGNLPIGAPPREWIDITEFAQGNYKYFWNEVLNSLGAQHGNQGN